MTEQGWDKNSEICTTLKGIIPSPAQKKISTQKILLFEKRKNFIRFQQQQADLRHVPLRQNPIEIFGSDVP